MSDVRSGRIPIGAFARMARLTVKALRHYDAEGVLTPAHVDPDSAYRYYDASQIADAATIGLLRGLDVPLPTIRDLLAAGPATRAQLLDAERDRVEREVEQRRRALATLDRLVAEPSATAYDVQFEERRARSFVGLAGMVAAARLDFGTGALCARLAGALAETGATAGRSPFVATFPLDLDEEFEVRVGVEVAASSARSAAAETSALPSTFELAGGRWASTIHVGPYSALPLAYGALLSRVRELGGEPLAPVTETYLTDPSSAPESEWITSLAVQVA